MSDEQNHRVCSLTFGPSDRRLGKHSFLLSIYDSNESIDFIHGKSTNFYWRIKTFYQ
jgi:hypothetical protein